jgi:hypothetical protein
MTPEIFTLRKQELKRRVESLPLEVKAWRAATEADVDNQAHFSQLQAIEILTNVFVDQQTPMINTLDPAGDVEAFKNGCMTLVNSIIRAHKTWDFFRDKLDLRHSPTHKDPLWVADTIAWDCHRPVMERAAQLGIVDHNKLREPPLVYCTADYSPATWVRGSRPNDGRAYDLGETRLPIPVIEMPWDHLGCAWEYLALHHEVGHDIEADLSLRPVLQLSLQNKLSAAGVPNKRIAIWLKWVGEIFADLCGLELAGPAFADSLMHLLLLPSVAVKTFDEDDPHPTHYPRILMNAEYIRTVLGTSSAMLETSQAMKDHAARIETTWKNIYGNTSGNPDLDAFLEDFPKVAESLMNMKFAELQNHTVRELIPYTEADDLRIRSAERFFRTNMNRPNALPIRHAVSAARIALTTAGQSGPVSDQLCNDINQRVVDYVRQSAPPGLRGGGATEHEKFIAGFTERMFPA